MIAKIYQPYLLEGLTLNKFDNYYNAIEEEVSKLFEDVRLDCNGEVTNGSGIDGWRQWCNWNGANNDLKGEKGYYAYWDYQFWYDWRLDPMVIADQFNDFIEGVCRSTGHEKICISSMCLGTNILMAYISKYGTKRLHGVSFDGSVVGGSELLTEPICGKFKVDGNAISRFLVDSNAMNLFSVDEFISVTIELLEKSGAIDAIVDYTRATVYDKIVKGVTSALALSTFFTWPGYWAGVTTEDYETAKEYVFGPQGSEKRTEYAGLISKIDNYHYNVAEKLPELLNTIKENGINIAVIAKYGSQIGPMCESNDAIADQIASVNRASFGATTSTIYDTLSDEYISKRIAEGKGKYIAPDKQIDASTCMFPDSTWFVKNARHSDWTYIENQITYTVVTADRQLTIDDFDCTQFIVYDLETKIASPMTTENCDTYNWTADASADNPSNFIGRIKSFGECFVRWFKLFIKFVSKNINKKEETTLA